jgi:hypothetical protein
MFTKLKKILQSSKKILLALSLILNIVLILVIYISSSSSSSPSTHKISSSEDKIQSKETVAVNEAGDSLDTRVTITIYANPLGNIAAEYNIPLSELGYNFKVKLPAFKYDFPILFNIPVPISEVAKEVENKIIECKLINSKNPDLTYNLKYTKYELISGEPELEVKLDSIKSIHDFDRLQIRISTIKMVNNDSYFYAFSYPVTNSMDNNILVDINVITRFSFGISDYFSEAGKFISATGERLKNLKSIESKKEGDRVFISYEEVVLRPEEEININLSATNLSLMPPWSRVLFWTTVFGFLLFAAVTPPVLLVISSLTWLFKKIRLLTSDKKTE